MQMKKEKITQDTKGKKVRRRRRFAGGTTAGHGRREDSRIG